MFTLEVLSHTFTVYDYPFGIFWSLYCLSSFYRVWLPLWYFLAIVLSVGRFTVFDYPFGIFWPLHCLSVALRCMITPWSVIVHDPVPCNMTQTYQTLLWCILRPDFAFINEDVIRCSRNPSWRRIEKYIVYHIHTWHKVCIWWVVSNGQNHIFPFVTYLMLDELYSQTKKYIITDINCNILQMTLNLYSWLCFE